MERIKGGGRFGVSVRHAADADERPPAPMPPNIEMTRLAEHRSDDQQERFRATVQQSVYTGKGSIIDSMA